MKKILLITIILLSSIIILPTAVNAQSIKTCNVSAINDTFDGTTLNQFWKANTDLKSKVTVNNDLNLTTSTGTSINSVSTFAGDFQFEIELKAFTTSRDTASTSRINVWTNLSIQSDGSNSVQIKLKRDTDGDVVLFQASKGDAATIIGASAIDSFGSLKFKLVRIGTTIYGFVNKDNKGFEQLGKIENAFTTAVSVSIGIFTDNYSQSVTKNSTWDNFVYKCPDTIDEQKTNPTPTASVTTVQPTATQPNNQNLEVPSNQIYLILFIPVFIIILALLYFLSKSFGHKH